MTIDIRLRRTAKLAAVGLGLSLNLFGCWTSRSLHMHAHRTALETSCLAASTVTAPDGNADTPHKKATDIEANTLDVSGRLRSQVEASPGSGSGEHALNAKLVVSDDAESSAVSDAVFVSDFGGRR